MLGSDTFSYVELRYVRHFKQEKRGVEYLLVKLEKAVQSLCGYILTVEYGTVIPTSMIEHVTGISKERTAALYFRVIKKVKEELKNDHSKAIEAVNGIGYRLVPPDEYTDYSLGYIKRGMSTMSRGTSQLRHAPVSEMSDINRQIYRNVADRINLLEAAMKGTKTELRVLTDKKRHPFLIENKN